MPSANDKQIAGDHYKLGGEEHWDRIWRIYGRGYFVGCITKYVERYHAKNGKQDLEKAIHFLEKLIELEYDPPLVRKETKAADDQRPDRNCYTLPDGACVSDVECMHGPGIGFFLPGQVNPSGWGGFIFEGANAEGFLYTCKACRGHFYVPADTNPNNRHRCPTEGDATPAYVGQAAT